MVTYCYCHSIFLGKNKAKNYDSLRQGFNRYHLRLIQHKVLSFDAVIVVVIFVTISMIKLDSNVIGGNYRKQDRY